MKNNKRMRLAFSLAILCCVAIPSYATIAKFGMIGLTPTAVTVPQNGTAIVQYRVVNHTKYTRTITMVPMPGVTQDTSDSSYCSNPFTLANETTCLLTLSLDGSQIPNLLQGGPTLCKTLAGGNNQPDTFMCSQPSTNYMLSATVGAAIPSNYQAAYITNFSDNTISLCFVNALTGLLERCNIAAANGTIIRPEAVATNPGVTLLYVANVGGSVSYCNINNQTGALSGCQNTGNDFSAPSGIVINPSNTLAYVSNITSDSVSLCTVAAGGALSGCISTGSGFSQTSGLAMNPSGTYVYVSNFLPNTVRNCVIGGGGDLTCSTTTTGFSGPEGVTVNQLDSYAYITNKTNNTITLCSIASNLLTGCATTGGTFTGVGNLAFNADGTLAYVPSSSSSLSVCAVNSGSGALSNCVDSGGTGLTNPAGVLLTTLS
ncbi:MAG: YncE family protein [Legionellaceae bacterium]|nr:YncE family protein [Legionellaceae bacterium]